MNVKTRTPPLEIKWKAPKRLWVFDYIVVPVLNIFRNP